MSDRNLFPETIETDRLRLERLDEAITVLEQYDHVKVGAPHIDEVTEHMTWSPHETPNETREFLDGVTEGWENGDRAEYAIVPCEDEPLAGEYAGSAGMGIDWDRRTGTLGMWLRKPLWGRGYSGERAAAFLRLAFERLDLEIVAVTHLPENEKSRRAIEKYVDRFGGRREGRFRNFETHRDEGPVDSVRYTISRDEWAANRPENSAVRFE
ncbi:MAG: ribosomal-protein-alanine N-acetyltransferase [Halobacteriales archaeon]|jgi:ribosomal-protein-alanine N-acetyltransferase